jgi:hypothetical protein
MKMSLIEKIFKLNSLILSIILSFIVYPKYSFSYENDSKHMYLGVDVIYSKLRFAKNYGDNMFSKKMIPGANFFAGYMITDHLGVEGGYEINKTMRRTATLRTGDIAIGGLPIPALVAFESYRTIIYSKQQKHLGLIAKHNITDYDLISLMLGLTFSNIKTNSHLFDDGPAGEVDIKRTFSKRKVVPLVRGTFEHKFNSSVGTRALLSWRKTSSFKVKSIENPGGNAEIRLKDTLSLGLGVTWYI